MLAQKIFLEKHELRTITTLLENGHKVVCIPRSNVEGVHTADIRLDDSLIWEMKAPKGSGKYLIQNTLQRAVKQSKNIIIDLYRTKRNQQKCIQEIKKEFHRSKSIKRIKIITKEKIIIDLEVK